MKTKLRFLSPLLIAVMAITLCGCSSGKHESQSVSLQLEDYETATIGAWAGSVYEAAVMERLPGSTVVNYDTIAEMAQCVVDGKLDAFCVSECILSALSRVNDSVRPLEENIGTYDAGFVVRKDRNDGLLQDFNAFLGELRDSGELDKMAEVWMNGDTEPIPSEFSGENGKLVIAMDALNEPFIFLKDGEYMGYDLDMAARYCVSRGYELVFVDAPFTMLIPGLNSGEYDMAAGSLEATSERREIVDFSDPSYSGGMRLVVKNDEKTDVGFFEALRFSFERTFIRENRWQMFVSGIATTLIISAASIVFGSLLGFFLYFICRGGNKLINKISGFFMWLVDGMPMVVLLMILYYIVFGKAGLSGIWISIIGFTLTFTSSTFGMVSSGVNAVDSGQMEAALAIGYGTNRAFFRMIFPQAVRHIVSPFKSSVIQHIKLTSIVGYIAVQDLTKMSDIIRSRTYEAFFPLIVTAVIYFIIEALIIFLISRIEIRLDPVNKDSRLLKEVKRK